MPAAIVASHFEWLEACIMLILIMDGEYSNSVTNYTRISGKGQ